MTDFEREYESFHSDTIKRYRDLLKKSSIIIKMGKGKIQDYSDFFLYSCYLKEFTKDDKGGSLVSQSDINKAAADLLELIKKDIETGDVKTKAKAYTYLAAICHYQKEDNKKALECYDKAVSLDESILIDRAQFKNLHLNDRDGALVDLNRALELEKDPDIISIIKSNIEDIDIIRNTDKTLADIKFEWIKIIAIIIFGLIFIAYRIYLALN